MSALSATFLSPPRLPTLRPRPSLRQTAICSSKKPSTNVQDAERRQIPGGARLLSTLSDESPLERRLARIRFAYELPEEKLPPSPCTLRYRCPKGHIITARPNTPACRNCPACVQEMSENAHRCNGRKLNMCQLSALAHSRGGRLLSTSYVDARTPLVWACRHGHVWKATVSNIRSAKSWCPECARQRRKLSMDDMHDMAHERGGQCLSKEYISEHVKLKWRCAKGHEFMLAPNNIRRSPDGKRKPTWCKICAKEERAKSSAVTSRRKGKARNTVSRNAKPLAKTAIGRVPAAKS